MQKNTKQARAKINLRSNLSFETLTGRLTVEHGSDRHKTGTKRISDDSRRFIFRRRTFLFDQQFGVFFNFREVSE